MRLRADVAWLCDPARAGRGAAQAGGAATANWVAHELATLGYQVVRQPIPNAADNILAIKRAGPRAVLVSAHYDHLGVRDGVVYPGADDNASGVAVLLALARDAASRRYRHSIVFAAFGAEEWGLVGSKVYMQHPTWPLDHTLAVINFDMVGRSFFEAGANKPATAAVVGLEIDPGALRATESAARLAGLSLVTAPAGLVELFGYANRTDDWWFRRRGIPAIHFSTGMHEDYHRATDTPDKLDFEQIQRVARTAAGTLAYLAGAQLD